jgi:hypothetical protein
LPAGPAVLAAKTGALIVPVVNRRLEDGRYAAEHFEPIEVRDASDASVARATQRIAHALEAMVSPAPEQWHTFKPMWPQTAAEEAALAERAGRMLDGADAGRVDDTGRAEDGGRVQRRRRRAHGEQAATPGDPADRPA